MKLLQCSYSDKRPSFVNSSAKQNKQPSSGMFWLINIGGKVDSVCISIFFWFFFFLKKELDSDHKTIFHNSFLLILLISVIIKRTSLVLTVFFLGGGYSLLLFLSFTLPSFASWSHWLFCVYALVVLVSSCPYLSFLLPSSSLSLAHISILSLSFISLAVDKVCLLSRFFLHSSFLELPHSTLPSSLSLVLSLHLSTSWFSGCLAESVPHINLQKGFRSQRQCVLRAHAVTLPLI